MRSHSSKEAQSEGEIASSIQFFRGRRVILDFDLADIYGVTTRRLNEQVKRNLARFPDDFMFRLDVDEWSATNRSQIATGSQKHRGPGNPPAAFTEHGAIMAATVLSSPLAIEMSLYVVRAFLKTREMLASNADLANKLVELEAKLGHKLISHDKAIASILAAIRHLMMPPASPRRGIGFTADIEPAE